jgi:hypothetical protein
MSYFDISTLKLTVAISARQAANEEVHGSSQLARAAANAIVMIDMRLITDRRPVDLDFSVASDLIPLNA